MFTRTINSLKSIARDVVNFSKFITVISQIIVAGYFTYLCFMGLGLLPLNIVLIAVSLVYLVLYFATYGNKEETTRKARRYTLRIGKALEILGKAVTLGISIYGIYLSSTANPITIILSTLSIIGWIMQAVIEIVSVYIEIKFEELKACISEDVKPFEPVVNTIKGTVKVISQVPEEVKETVVETVETVKHGVRAIKGIKRLFYKSKEIPNLVNGSAHTASDDEKNPELIKK